MFFVIATSLIGMAIPASTTICPEGVVDQLDGLYRWQVQRMDGNEDPVQAFASQRQRFTPSLFELLLQAKELTPMRDGRFLDFDVFSNTQVSTFGATVKGCRAKAKGSLADCSTNSSSTTREAGGSTTSPTSMKRRSN